MEGQKACEGGTSQDNCDPDGACFLAVDKAGVECTDDDMYWDEEGPGSYKSIKEVLEQMTMMCSSDCLRMAMDAMAMDCLEAGEDGANMEKMCYSDQCQNTIEYLAACDEEIPGQYHDNGMPFIVSDLAKGPMMMCGPCGSAVTDMVALNCWMPDNCGGKCSDKIETALEYCDGDGMDEMMHSVKSAETTCSECGQNYWKLVLDTTCHTPEGFCGTECEEAFITVMKTCTDDHMVEIDGEEQPIKAGRIMRQFSDNKCDGEGEGGGGGDGSCMTVKIPSKIARMYTVRRCEMPEMPGK